MMMALPGQFKVRPVFYRETASLMYSPWPYMIATLVAELPWLALSLVVGPTMSYFMIGASLDVCHCLSPSYSNIILSFLLLTPLSINPGLSSDAGVFFTHYLGLYLLALSYVLLGVSLANAMPTFEVAQASRRNE